MAARQDLDDLPQETDPVVRHRLLTALAEATTLLRSQLAELNPAVLEQAGLVTALTRLADDQTRGRMTAIVETSAWSASGAGHRTHADVDRLLFDAARELLVNAVKHSRAESVLVRLEESDGMARLTVEDDGVGFDADVLDERLSDGHIGLTSRRLRVESAGGRLEIGAGAAGRGTSVTVTVPVTWRV
jgi:two-component system NarL family sensor kinase